MTPPLSALLTLLLSYIIIIILEVGGFHFDISSNTVILTCLCFLCSFALLIRGKIAPLYYVQMLVFFVLTYSIQASVGARYLMWMTSPSPITPKATALFALHLVLFTGAAVGSSQRRPAIRPSRWHASSIILNLLIVSAILGAAILVIGPETYFTSRSENPRSDSETWMLGFEYYSKSLLYLLAVALVVQAPSRSSNLLIYMVFLIVLVAALIISNPVNTARFVSLSGICLVLLALAHRLGARRAILTSISTVPLLLIVILPITSLMRSGLGSLELAVVSDMGTSLEFSQMQLFLDALGYLDTRPLFSNHTLTAFFIFIPRFIWDGKSSGLGPEVADYYGYVFSNVALPSFMYVYADYGYGGLAIGSAVVGFVFGRIDVNFRGNFDFNARRMMYGLMVTALIPIIARGDLTTSMIGLYAFAASYETLRILSRITIRSAGERMSAPRTLVAEQRLKMPLR